MVDFLFLRIAVRSDGLSAYFIQKRFALAHLGAMLGAGIQLSIDLDAGARRVTRNICQKFFDAARLMIVRQRCGWAIVAVSFTFLAGTPSIGQENLLPRPTFPTYNQVVGVASDDVLNIRSGPTSQGSIVGSLQPDAAPIEVIETREGWGRVIAGEGNGWVKMTFLQEMQATFVNGTKVPIANICLGSEPFWSLKFTTDEKASFINTEISELVIDVTHGGPVIGRATGDVIWMRGTNSVASASISREFCSDGMSDRYYGQRILFSLSANGQAQSYEGCCMVRPAGQ